MAENLKINVRFFAHFARKLQIKDAYHTIQLEYPACAVAAAAARCLSQ